MAWTAFAFQGPEAAVQAALDALRGAPGGADLIRPAEGESLLPPVVAIPGHKLFGYALPPGSPVPETPAGCFPVAAQHAPPVLGLGPVQGGDD